MQINSKSMATQEQLSNQTDNEQLQFQGTNSSLKAEELLPAQLKEVHPTFRVIVY